MTNAQIVAFKGSSACSAIKLGLSQEMVTTIMDHLNDLLGSGDIASNGRHASAGDTLSPQHVGADQNFGLSGGAALS